MRQVPGGDAPLPPIMLGEGDQERLFDLAYAIRKRAPEVADVLIAELDRAEIRAPDAIPADVVTMGSTVHFRDEDGQERTVKLVWPREADIGAGRISVATPVGAALIGLAMGQSFGWAGRDRQDHRLTVLGVTPAVGH